MRYFALAVALVLTALGQSAPASADMPAPVKETTVPAQSISVDSKTKWVIYGNHDQYVLERVSPTQFAPPCNLPIQHGCWPVAPDGKRYAMEVAPDGFGQPYMVADLIGQGTAPLRYDNSGNLYVTLGGSGAVLAPLPGGSNTAAGANQSIGIQAYDGTTNMVPITETGGAIDVNLKSQSGGLTLSNIAKDALPVDSSTGCAGATNCFTTASTPGCAGGPAMPCTWLVHTGATTLYSMTWVSNQSMTTLGDNLTCWDNTAAGTASNIIINAGQFLANQTFTFNSGNGKHITTGIFCSIAGSTLASGSQILQVDTRP